MELQFKKKSISCLKSTLREVQNTEQTQELRLSDGMPDIGRILSAWGQVILRGKEWLSDSVSLSGGMMVWVLYMPEDGAEPMCIDTWVPFQLQWDLPAGIPDGNIRVECLTRFVDARSVSARKIMLRCGIAALAEAYVPMEEYTYLPEKVPEDVQLLSVTYPVRLAKEAGEKTFLLDEDISLPPSAPRPEKLIYYRVTPVVNDQRVMADKVVFRGVGIVHLLYVCQDGQLHSWDFELPFSQFAELKQSHSAEAQADILLGVISLEVDMDDAGQMHLKCGLVGQYLVSDIHMLKLVEDAYSTIRDLDSQEQKLSLPTVLESRLEVVDAEQVMPLDANVVADTQFLPDFPRQRRLDDKIRLEMPGTFQILYYDQEGILQSGNARWEGAMEIPSHPDNILSAALVGTGIPKTMQGSGAVTVKAEPQLQLNTMSEKGIPMVAGFELGEEKERNENRPSLILQRSGDAGLWELAKISGSTMEAIRDVNGLAGDPEPGQMLLIPIL